VAGSVTPVSESEIHAATADYLDATAVIKEKLAALDRRTDLKPDTELRGIDAQLEAQERALNTVAVAAPGHNVELVAQEQARLSATRKNIREQLAKLDAARLRGRIT
jgi:hypothetical protein